MNFERGDRVTWKPDVLAYDRPPVRNGIFDHYVDHSDFWAEEKALITNVDGTDASLYIEVEKLKHAMH